VAGNPTITATPICRKSGSKPFYFNVLKLILGVYSPYLNNVLEMVSFGSQTHITPNKHVVHCTLNLCWRNVFFLTSSSLRIITIDPGFIL